MTPHLYANPNPHAPVRGNGIRGWFHPSRRGGLEAIRLIVIHTAENTPDLHPPDTGAEAVAAFQSRVKRPSSYHRIVDSDTVKVMLPNEAVAFGAVGANTIGLHLSFATYAHMWQKLPDWWVDAALRLAAREARAWATEFRIPVVRLTPSQIRGRHRGFVAHADTEDVFGEPGRRSDPGDLFPWARFFDLVRHHPEDDMPLTDDEKREIARLTAEELKDQQADIARLAADEVMSRLWPSTSGAPKPGMPLKQEIDGLRVSSRDQAAALKRIEERLEKLTADPG